MYCIRHITVLFSYSALGCKSVIINQSINHAIPILAVISLAEFTAPWHYHFFCRCYHWINVDSLIFCPITAHMSCVTLIVRWLLKTQ